MTPFRVTLVTIGVSGPHHDDRWLWQVDGPGGANTGHEGTEAEAWAVARRRAVGVLGRVEVPRGGGGQLAAAIEGPRCVP